MELVTSWEKEYFNFKETAHRIGSVGNCYFSADSFRKYVFWGKLYRLPMEKGVCFFVDRGSKWEIYFCGAEDTGWKIPAFKKPVVANFVFQQNTNSIGEEERILLSKGMRLKSVWLDFMIGRPDAEKEFCFKEVMDRIQKLGFKMGMLDHELFQEAYQILCKCISPFDIAGYEEMNFPQMLIEQGIFSAIDSQGRLCAICVLPSSFPGGLIAVIPEKRGIGLGKAIQYYSYHIAKDASKQHLWIAVDNIRNQHLMQQMGALGTGRILRQYVLKGYGTESEMYIK